MSLDIDQRRLTLLPTSCPFRNGCVCWESVLLKLQRSCQWKQLATIMKCSTRCSTNWSGSETVFSRTPRHQSSCTLAQVREKSVSFCLTAIVREHLKHVGTSLIKYAGMSVCLHLRFICLMFGCHLCRCSDMISRRRFQRQEDSKVQSTMVSGQMFTTSSFTIECGAWKRGLSLSVLQPQRGHDPHFAREWPNQGCSVQACTTWGAHRKRRVSRFDRHGTDWTWPCSQACGQLFGSCGRHHLSPFIWDPAFFCILRFSSTVFHFPVSFLFTLLHFYALLFNTHTDKRTNERTNEQAKKQASKQENNQRTTQPN